MIQIEDLTDSNYTEIAALAFKLWPDSTLEAEQEHFRKCIRDSSQNAFLLSLDNKGVGFISVSLRTEYVEGAKDKPVCYIEGLYVDPAFRKKGYAQMLVRKAEEWGKQNHCSEMASDAEIGNTGSIAFHKRVGFREVNRVVCFVKAIP